MRWGWVTLALLLAAGAGARRKHHKHQKLGRALSSGLQPAPVSAEAAAVAHANATCGELGQEDYCRELPAKRGTICDVCDAEAVARAHPLQHALDGDAATWWQSPTLARGERYQHVSLLFQFPDELELMYVILKSGPSPRPLAWSLEISTSAHGDDWTMIRAFGDRDQCWRLWGLRPERRRRRARAASGAHRARRKHRADNITCSTQFASPRPLQNGEMHVGLGEGEATLRVRISFRASHPGPPEQRYYTLRTLVLGARCRCHGHAHRCSLSTQGSVCECQHGTCGNHCERCCSGEKWSPGLPCGGNEGGGEGAVKSDDCSCAERGACAVDDSGAILCVNCTENRAGPLCDRCLSGFYNSRADGPCKPCPCHPIGSDGTCKWDKIRNEVSCNCLVGFAGSLCDSCADTSAVFPDCATPATTSYCKCDSRGVVNPEDACVSVCECKAHVTGETCSACKPGYYGLNGDLVEGCRRCYCSGVTELCAADPDPGDTVELPLGESSWFVVDAELNETHAPSLDDAGHLSFIIYEVDGWKGFFWLTELWNGTQLDAYGGSLVFQTFWGVMRGDTGGVPTVGPDVILITNDGIQIASINTSYQEAGSREISVPLVEGQWYRFVPGQDRGEVLTRAQFMEALSDVRALMLRAQFHSDEDEVRLEKVRVVGGEGGSREVCGCPAGYEGAHCEHCAWSHARLERAPGSVPRFECVPCPCNGHADCDVVDGTCGECHHNTTGVHCERCLPGHYGNPTVGPCRSCACPLLLPSNNFSPNCALAAAEGDEYVCTQCPRGYTGDHCELCDFGYWGSPTTPGGACAPCACDGAPCDQNTGECLKCPPHAGGVRCDQCEEGYWQDPNATLEARVGVPCRGCGCGPGALSAACDQRTGHCVCRDGWTGRACDRCDHGHGNAEAGCPACRCGVAALSPSCDPQTGFCECAGGAATPSCDVCLPEYYGLTDSGCIGCNCSSLGAEGNSCDIRTGQCRCRPHVTGRACDRCQEGYWGLSSEGCRRCSCGPGAAACDRRTGACACAPGVGGARCDACLPGYYGFGPAGCLSCPPCGAGKVCEASSGRCVCPARSRGAGCRACAPGHWRAPDGCRPCDCGAGALTATCDPHSGQCSCRAGWAGRACDACAGGHHGPRCRPCACDRAGTRLCDETGMCPCDDSGQCDCKDNVEGEKCDVCRAGTFGLSAENPVGCTACFCFGRSAHCTQAGLTRAAVHAATPRRLVLHHHQGNIRHHEHLDMNSLLSLPPETLEVSLPAPPAPVYMELDKRFLGDRVTSYGGLLQFTVLEEGGEELSEDVLIQYPLVRLYAAHSIVLDFFQRDPAINGTHYVRFHESLWRARAHGSEAIASRAALMVALSDLKRILVRVTTRTAMYGRHVHASLLNVSLDTAIPGGGRSATALGVELCACPSKYAASSCHQPAVGFWQPPLRVNMHHVAGTIVIDLEGDAQPCYCNGRARTCDPVTGHCLNCSEGTGGPRCEVCAEGYHGTAETGCQACPCPERARNFATSCIFTDDRLQCLCKPGYAGTECESCASGWWRAADGACAPCHCDPRGALIPHCDHFGRCQCREFATGTKCDRCKMRRTFFGEDGCQPCDSCSQTLLDGVEELIKELDTKANIEGLSRIPKPYPALQQFHANYTTLSRSLDNAEETSRSAKKLNSLLDALENKFLGLKNFSDVIKSETFKQDDKAQSLSLESMSALEQILSEKAKIAAKVTELDDFARGERHMSAHRALKEARHLLHAIRQIGLIDYVSVANNIFDTANLKSTSVKELNYRVDDALGRAKNLLQGLDQWHLKINDLNNLTAKIWKIGDRIMETAEKTRPKLSALKDTHLRTRLVLEDVITLNNHNFTNETAALISEAQLLLSGIPILASELTTLMTAAEEKAGILHNLIPKYKHKYVEAAERHVAELHAKAKNYMSLFAEARGGAAAGVEASRAWARVSDALQDATAAADGALVATRKAAKLVHGPLPLINRAHHAKDVSARQKVKGEEVLRKAEDLRAELERLRRGTERVSVALRGLGWQERELGARPQADVSELLRVANEQSDRVFSTTRVLYDEASEFRRRARYYLRPQLAELQRHGDTALGAAQEHVSQIRGNTLRANEVAGALADAAEARAHEHRAADLTLSPALAQLRDKIAKAKHAADSISVSLTSVQGQSTGCSRSYIGSATPTAITRVTLAISFDGKVHDGPLLWLGNREGPGDETQTYLQLLVRNQKLQLTWNLGDGEGVVDHPETLQPTRDDLDHTSYRIELERVWNTVRLSVERIGGGSGEPVVASNATGTHVTLVAPELWLGSPKDSAGLPGCVHALYYDDKRLGLWNFISQPEGMRCTGCTQRWYGSSRSGATLAWFDGSGYAELRRSELRPPDRRHFSVALAFRTRDEDAVLFVTHDATNNRSLSVSLRSCRVVFRVEYAAAAALEIVAAGRHCHGRPVHVQAIRVFAKNNLEKGSLRVNGEETLGSPEPPVQDAGALPDLSNAPYWLGGVPPGALLAAPPLLGCLGALMVDREGYDLLNTPRRYGVEARCGNRVLRSVMLRGSGWVELPSPGIRRRSAIGLSFVAQQPRGLLLLRAPSIPESDNEVDDDDTDDQHHLSLALVDGELEVSAAAGKSELRLRTNGSALSDGLLHTVRIVRAHKQLELWVDERMVAHGSLAGGAIAPRPRGLYLGGAPAHLNVTVKPRVGGFSGTITDLIVDGTLIGMENAVNWNSAALGRAQREPPNAQRAALRPLHAPTPTAQCTKSSSYTVEPGAVKFGDAAQSHATLRPAARALRDLALSMQFRTFRPEGLLLLAPGSKSKPKHYLALSLREGHLRLVVRGRRRRELNLQTPVADGAWRSVTIRVSPGRLVLASGGTAATAKPPRKLGLAARLYVGGLPDRAVIPNVPDNISRASGFVGCVRRVTVGGRAEDLVRDAAHHHRVGQCFPRVEPAAFFAGDAYTTWSSAWTGAGGGGGGAKIRIEFRTSEMTGVLLAAQNFVLEIREGALVLTRRSPTGEQTKVECRGVAETALCDDSWHEAAARVSAGVLELSVDAGPARVLQPPQLLSDDADATNAPAPLYVGGLPESASEWWSGRENFKGCLRTVTVDGERRDWPKMQELHNVLIDSCPIPQ